MGNARWDDSKYTAYSSSISDKTPEEVFKQRGIHPDLDPLHITVREAFDSPANPAATPLILGCDETGSMAHLADQIIREGLGKIMKQVYDTKPITDPQIMCMGLGDADCDTAPLQMTQFEASVDPLVEQVAKIYIERHGGGNMGESYLFAWYAAVHMTSCHAITKRGRKGYLFTIGDEACLPEISAERITRFTGRGAQAAIKATEILAEAQQFWNVFHLIVKPVPNQPVVQSWQELLKDRAVMVEDHEKLPETIVAIIRLTEGQSNVTAGYDTATAQIVGAATKQLAGAKP